MTGLEKMIAEIRGESEKTVRGILDKAQAEADAVMQRAQQQADEAGASIAEKSKKQAADIVERAKTAAEFRNRQRILAEKQAQISDVFSETLRRAAALPDDRYFGLVAAMAAEAAHPGEEGEIRFGKKDLGRLPRDFESSLAPKLPAGAVLRVSETPAPIESGFVLSYGSTEENCSFEAVLASRREDLQDRVREILFS